MQPAPFDLARIGAGLPFASAVEELTTVLAAPGTAVVVEAPPGTGKTTVVPAAVANTVAGRVLVAQPRRVAVRAAARRLARLDGSALGERVGYSIRGERLLQPTARIEFATPGLLLRRLLHDPALPGVGAVVLDEVHERQLDTDVLLALLADLREVREDLTLVVMSATLDAPRYAALLGADAPTPVVGVSAPTHPVAVEWAPAGGPRLDGAGVRREFLDHVAAVTARAHRAALAQEPSTDALVFLPGVREVEHVAARLAHELAEAEVLALHGRVEAAAQDRAVSGRPAGGPPRVVVSTALAESSLTVPGVRLVVDAGLSREPRVDRARGMSGLVTVATSRATAVQRAGRAGRQGPGTVVRCYDERTHAAAPAHPTPELETSDLTTAMLVVAAWGTPGGAGLRWLDPPPRAAVDDAVAVLSALGAVDADGRTTSLGERLARMPLDPRWGRALLECAESAGARAAAEAVAAASDDLRPTGADLAEALSALRNGRHPHTRAWRRESERLRRLAGGPEGGPATAEVLAAAVAAAWPERVARRVEGTTYLLAGGTRAALPGDSRLLGEEWLAIADVSRAEGRHAAGTGAVIRSAVPLPVATVLDGPLVRDEVVAEFADGRVRGRRVRRCGAIELASTPVRLEADAGADAVAAALRGRGLGLLPVVGAADSLRRRLAFLHRHLGEPWPAVDDASLLARAEEWLGPELRALAEGTPTSALDLLDAVRRLLPWPEAARLDELAPPRLVVPSGRAVLLTYPAVDDDGPVVVEVKLQECFGLAESPRVAGVPVLFHLLSPAGRPLAVTADLASFWAGPYAQVRAEMRGRYPKHPWPEDPWSAPATARTTRSSRS